MSRSSWTVPSMHGAYHVTVGAGIALGQGLLPAPSSPGARTVLLTHPSLLPLMGERVAAALRSHGEVLVLTVPEGEGSKALAVAEGLWDRLAGERFSRRDRIVCLGGGVIGDLGGFVAATWMRGIDYVSLPTTLLAQVDSSIGGKVAVNLTAGKNLVGCFYPPRAVVSDVSFLATLPEREYRSGLAEVVKYGAVLDAELFRLLERRRGEIMARDPETLEEVVSRCARIKSGIVAEDEREGGARALLNFGHTLGHAIEAETGYGTTSHGEAVSMGMAFALKLSGTLLGIAESEAARVTELLADFGLPIHIPGVDPERLIERMKIDKKVRGNDAIFILTPTIGVGSVRGEIGWNVVQDALTEKRRVRE